MADFSDRYGELREEGIEVFALSSDGAEEARRMVEDHALDFPVGHDLDPETARDRLGARIDEEGGFVHATGFLLRPDGTVIRSVYATGAVGRLTPTDILESVKFFRDDGGGG